MKIVFATQNQNKVAEIQKLIPNEIELLSLKDINCDADIPETAETLEGNASIKSNFVLSTFNVDCFADDTGLEIEALNGEPGVRSARYADEHLKSDDKNIELVLQKLDQKTDRKAQFRTVISLRMNKTEYLFEGIAKGRIAKSKRGDSGFGYDPIFIPEGYDKSFAEMTMAEKNAISHRGKAIEKLVVFLNTIKGI